MAAIQPDPAAVTACLKTASLHVPCGEYPRNVGFRPVSCQKVTAFVHIELAFEQIGVGDMADGDKEAIAGKIFLPGHLGGVSG